MRKNSTYFWQKKVFLSFFAMFLVVIIHNSATSQYSLSPDIFTKTADTMHIFFAHGLGSLAVPLFFFLSGFTFFRNYKSDSYFKKIRSRIKSIFIPFLIWNTIGLLFAILYTYTPLSSFIAGREPFYFSISNVFEGIFLYKYNFQFWFLYDLMFYIILTPLFFLTLRRKWLSLCCGIIFFILPNFFDSFLGVNLYFLIFYYIGCFLGKFYFSRFSRAFPSRLSTFALVVFVICLSLRTLSLFNIILVPNVLSHLNLVVLVLSFWICSDLFITKVSQKKYFAESFPLYALHTYFLSSIIKIIYLLAPQNSILLLFNEIFSPLLTVAIVTTIALIWHKKLPKSYSLVFGRN